MSNVKEHGERVELRDDIDRSKDTHDLLSQMELEESEEDLIAKLGRLQVENPDAFNIELAKIATERGEGAVVELLARVSSIVDVEYDYIERKKKRYPVMRLFVPHGRDVAMGLEKVRAVAKYIATGGDFIEAQKKLAKMQEEVEDFNNKSEEEQKLESEIEESKKKLEQIRSQR